VSWDAGRIAAAFDVPRWLIDATYTPTPAERNAWIRRLRKDRNRARYRRRYARGRR
jgi:hypothetical protein